MCKNCDADYFENGVSGVSSLIAFSCKILQHAQLSETLDLAVIVSQNLLATLTKSTQLFSVLV